MLRSAFLLLVGTMLIEAYDFSPPMINHCQTIPANFSLCYGIGYTRMYLPNLLNHESLTEILYELPLWQSLLSLGCHSNARLLLCSILAPVCLQQIQESHPIQSAFVSFDNNNQDSMSTSTNNNQKFLLPCRTLCESVKRSCESRMVSQFGYKWPMMIACDQYPADTDLCVSHSSSSTTSTTTTVASTTITTTTTLATGKVNLCSMCHSIPSVSELLDDYCRSSLVVRTRPVKITSSGNTLTFANKHKVRYFKRPDHNATMNIKLNFVRKCPCLKLHVPTILFVSSSGEPIRFIPVKRNPRAFRRFRHTIVLRKPRCQYHALT